jgi:tetratricopeptide (TPR) repeat protein
LLDAIAQRRADPGQREALSRSLNDLGVVYNALQRYRDAERVLGEALTIRRAAFGDIHRSVGITANNLAASLYFQQQLDSAQVVQALAVRALQSSVGPDHQRTVVALGNLAAFRRAAGDLAGAESSYRELAMRQTRLQGREHPVTARVLSSLAIVVADRGRKEGSYLLLAEAEGLYREANTVFERRLGPDHPQVGQTLDRLAGVLLLRGRPAEAIPLSVRALSVLRRGAADTSRVVRDAADLLAALHRAAGDTAAAREVERRFSPTAKPR